MFLALSICAQVHCVISDISGLPQLIVKRQFSQDGVAEAAPGHPS